MIAGGNQRAQHSGAGTSASRNWHIERVGAVVSENVKRVRNVVDTCTVEKLSCGELDVEAIIHRRAGVLRVETLERWVVVPIAGRVGDILQLAGAGRHKCLIGGFGAGLHVEVADEKHVSALAK